MPKIRHQIDIRNNVMGKQDELMKKSIVYSTKRIDELTEQILAEGKADTTPFFSGKSDWRDNGIMFEYTDEELEELAKCANDCEYFVANYCKMLTDNGRTLVKLRDYQSRILNVMSGEKWNDKKQTMVPEHPQIVLMQARQTGKCVTGNTDVELDHASVEKIRDYNRTAYWVFSNKHMGNKVKMYEIYYSMLNPTFLDLIIYHAYCLNDKYPGKFDKIINKFESKKFENCYNDKLIESYDCQFNVLSVHGYNKVNKVHRTKLYDQYELILSDGKYLKCADNHMVLRTGKWTFVKDLQVGDNIYTEQGYISVKAVNKLDIPQYMFDFSVDNENKDELITDENHSYYTNGILSHNTTTTAAYLTWYITFHRDRNVFVCANKERTAVEIMGKIKEVLEGLPYFMKPGVISLAEKRIKFENGCSLKCAAASKSPATGDSIQLLYIDEAALIPENIIEEYWASIIPTMSSFTNSQIILSSTPRGRGNRFFKVVDGAINGENSFYYQRVDWWEVPGHDEEWADNQKKLLGEELFNREFGLSFDTAGTRIVSNHAAILINKIAKKFVTRDFYSVPPEISDCIRWAPDFDPTEMTYQDLKNKRFLLSVDTAQGIMAGTTSKKDADYNVINIFEIEPLSPNKIEQNRDNAPITLKDCIQYKQVGVYLDNIRDEARCAEAAKYIVFQILKCGLKDIDNCRVLLEINFNGNNWITKFKNHPSFYEAVIIKTVKGIQKPGQRIEQMKKQYGYRTTGGQHGKNYYCELGASMIHKRQIIPRQIDNDNINTSTVSQLMQFGQNSNGAYQGICCHDDLAITTLFVSIAQESKQFIAWVQDWIDQQKYNWKAVKVLQMLNTYIEQEAQISQEAFHNFYHAASATFGQLTYKQQGYGSIMNGELPPDYGNNGGYNNGGYNSNGYNSGYNNFNNGYSNNNGYGNNGFY